MSPFLAGRWETYEYESSNNHHAHQIEEENSSNNNKHRTIALCNKQQCNKLLDGPDAQSGKKDKER